MLGETVKLCEIMNQVRWQSGLKALKKGATHRSNWEIFQVSGPEGTSMVRKQH